MILTQTFEEREIPSAAMRMPLEFQLAAKKPSEDGDTFPFSMFARSAEPVKSWFWGDIYHDFSGMKVAPTIAVDYCHEEDIQTIIGKGDNFEIKDDGLHVSGELIQLEDKPSDPVFRLRKLAAKGVPFESSIDFRGPALYEQVYEGRVAQVNGRQIEGPALIVREWTLRRMAVCLSGMDPNTNSQFSQDDDQPVMVRIFSEGEPMTKTTMTGNKPADTKPATTQQLAEKPAGSDAGTGGTPSPAQQQGEGKPGSSAAASGDADPDPGAKFLAELKRYTDKFGAENGTKWYTENKTWSEACELHSDHLSKQLAAKEEQNQQLQNKLQGLHHGEDIPAQQGQDKNEPTPDGQGKFENRFADMGPLGTFASSLVIPGEKAA